MKQIGNIRIRPLWCAIIKPLKIGGAINSKSSTQIMLTTLSRVVASLPKNKTYLFFFLEALAILL